jgi:hypothetical protein
MDFTINMSRLKGASPVQRARCPLAHSQDGCVPSKNKTAAAISRGGCLKLLYAYLISSLIGSRPLEAPERFAVCVDETVPVASGAWHGLVWAKALAH